LKSRKNIVEPNCEKNTVANVSNSNRTTQKKGLLTRTSLIIYLEPKWLRWLLTVEEAKQVMAKNNWILAQTEPIEIGLPRVEKRACECALAYNLPWAKMATVIDGIGPRQVEENWVTNNLKNFEVKSFSKKL